MLIKINVAVALGFQPGIDRSNRSRAVFLFSGGLSHESIQEVPLSNLPQASRDSVELGGEVLAAALQLAADGVPVFPIWGLRRAIIPVAGEPTPELRCTCPLGVNCDNPGKHPVGSLVPHGHNDAELDLNTVRQWFNVPADGERSPKWQPFHLGVRLGNGLVVIDAESRSNRPDLPTGLEVLDDWESWTGGTSLPDGAARSRSGSGGVHVWLRVDPGLRVKSRPRVLPNVDLKADGGYVLAPPSGHTSGGFYEWLGGARGPADAGLLAGVAGGELLGWLLTVKGGRFIARRAGESATSAVPDDYDFQRIVAGTGCPAGHRDYFINDLCFRLRRSGATRRQATEALRREWLRMEHPPGDVFSWDACLYKLRRVWDEVEPEDVSDIPAWRPQRTVDGPTGGSENRTIKDAGAPYSELGDGLGADTGWVDSSDTGDTGGYDTGGYGATVAELLERPDLTFARSDTGNGARFAQRMREMVRFCTGEARWYLWDGSRWAQDELNRALHLTEEVVKDIHVDAARATGPDRDRIENWAHQSQSLARRRAMLEMAGAQPGIAITPDFLDSDPWLLVVRNGTLDLRTGTLRQSDPADLCTRRANVEYDADATCPTWLRHIEFVTGGDQSLAAWLRRAVGYTLTGLTDEQKLFFLWGNGANGKSTFVDVVAHVLGSYATQADGGLLAGRGDHPTQLAGLRGARLVVADETEQGKLAERRVKAVTGGKKIKARFMRQDYFEFTPRFKLWITGNHKPEIAGTDQGIWRRLKLVPFTNTLTDDTRIMGFDELLLAEAPGILNWALAGLADWRGIGGLGEPDAVSTATREYRNEEDLIGRWLADCVEVGVPGAETPSIDLYNSYKGWCYLNGLEPRSNIMLGRDLGQRGFKQLPQRRVIGYANPVRPWVGLRVVTG